jgi:hypothetical protein
MRSFIDSASAAAVNEKTSHELMQENLQVLSRGKGATSANASTGILDTRSSLLRVLKGPDEMRMMDDG